MSGRIDIDIANLPAAVGEKVDDTLAALFESFPADQRFGPTQESTRLAAFRWAQLYCQAAIEAWMGD